MMLIVCVERNQPGLIPPGFAAAISTYSDGFMKVARGLWLIYDVGHGPQGWTDLLSPFLGQHDRLMIFEATNNYGGLAPHAIWNWVDGAIAAGTVTPSFNVGQ